MRSETKRVIKFGLLGGSVVIYLAAVGMIWRFDSIPVITGVIQVSVLLMFIVFGLVGRISSDESSKDRLSLIRRGALAGALAGATVGLFSLTLEVMISGLGIDVREMFVSLGPETQRVLALGASPYVGAVLITLAGGIFGVVGTALRFLSGTPSKLVNTALVSTAVVALVAATLKPMLSNLRIPTRTLFTSDRLTVIGAVIVAVIAVLIRWGMIRFSMNRAATEHPQLLGRFDAKKVSMGIWIAALLVIPWLIGTFGADVLTTVGIYVLLGLGLNIVVGYAGLLDLGYVAFFAVGAYSTAILTARTSFMVDANVFEPAAAGFTNFWVALPVTVALAVLIGLAIGAPVLRLRGDYLAIVTLGFGEIIQTLVKSDWLKDVFGGSQGITSVSSLPFPRVGRIGGADVRIIYYFVLLAVVLCYVVVSRLKESRVGRAWAAMREDEDVAEGMGVSVIKYKLLAFATGAAIGCLGGAFFAAKVSVANADSFTLLVSINVLAVVVLGGMGSARGVILGSMVLVGLPEILREFGEYRLHIYGAILVAIMILRPEGLLPDVRRAMELRGDLHEPEKSLLSASATEGV